MTEVKYMPRERLKHLLRTGKTQDGAVKIMNTESDFIFYVSRDSVWKFIENKKDKEKDEKIN